MGFYAVADGDDDIEGVVLKVAGDLAIAFDLNCCKKCSRCLLLQFTLVINILDVAGDGGFIALEEFGELGEREPDGLADEADVDTGLAVLGLEEKEFAGVFHPSASW